MDILGLTSSEQVRATLGVETTDISETAVTALDLPSELTVDLGSWFPSWAALRDYAGSDADTLVQQSALKVYAKYYCCRKCVVPAAFGFLQRKSDGDNEAHRFNENAIEGIKAELDEQMDLAKGNVLGIETEFNESPSTAKYTQFSRAPASRDVISE